jgi:hypothetical protein
MIAQTSLLVRSCFQGTGVFGEPVCTILSALFLFRKVSHLLIVVDDSFALSDDGLSETVLVLVPVDCSTLSSNDDSDLDLKTGSSLPSE